MSCEIDANICGNAVMGQFGGQRSGPSDRQQVAGTEQQKQWHVMQLVFPGEGRRYNVRQSIELLEKNGVRCFYPMAERLSYRLGRPRICRTALIPNVIFAYATRELLDEFVRDESNCIRWKYDRFDYRKCLVVPSAQMDSFVKAYESVYAKTYYSFSELSALKKGDKVRILDGPLAGIEGTVVVKRGRPSAMRTILIEVEGWMAESIEISPQMVEIVDKIVDRN